MASSSSPPPPSVLIFLASTTVAWALLFLGSKFAARRSKHRRHGSLAVSPIKALDADSVHSHHHYHHLHRQHRTYSVSLPSILSRRHPSPTLPTHRPHHPRSHHSRRSLENEEAGLPDEGDVYGGLSEDGHCYNGTDASSSSSASPALAVHPGWLVWEVHAFDDWLVDRLHGRARIREDLESPSSSATSWIALTPNKLHLQKFYQYGATVAVVILAALPLAMLYSVCQMHLRGVHATSSATIRGHASSTAGDSELPLVLLPGVTLPLRELPVFLAASFLAILVHEAGHAVAAAV